MNLLLATLFSGLVVGASYALVAVGLTIIFGIGRIINFAHGELVMAGAYGTYLAVQLGMNYFLAAVFGILLSALLGFIIEKGVVARGLYTADEHSAIIATFAIGLILSNVALIAFGPDSKNVESPLIDVNIGIGAISTDGQRALTALIAAIVLVALAIWLRRSRTGLQVQAVADNVRGAMYSGVNIVRIRTLAFVGGSAMAGLAGALLAPSMTVFPTMGQTNVVIAFTVVILGGLGSIGGATIGGLFIGIVYALVATYLDAQWSTALGWALVVVLLLVRPQGILGKRPVRA